MLNKSTMQGVGAALVIMVAAYGIHEGYFDRFGMQDHKPAQAQQVVRIGVGSSLEQETLGELYKQGLERSGRKATVIYQEIETPEGRLPNAHYDMTVICTGVFLAKNNTHHMRSLLQDFSSHDYTAAEKREKIYETVMGNLPGAIGGADPSNAQCHNFSTHLPEHIVPIFRAEVLDRNDRNALNVISGSLTSEKLEKLIDQPGELSQKVHDFLDAAGVEF